MWHQLSFSVSRRMISNRINSVTCSLYSCISLANNTFVYSVFHEQADPSFHLFILEMKRKVGSCLASGCMHLTHIHAWHMPSDSLFVSTSFSIDKKQSWSQWKTALFVEISFILCLLPCVNFEQFFDRRRLFLNTFIIYYQLFIPFASFLVVIDLFELIFDLFFEKIEF